MPYRYYRYQIMEEYIQESIIFNQHFPQMTQFFFWNFTTHFWERFQ